MRKVKITFIILGLLIPGLSLNSCIVSGMAKKFCSVKEGAIPPNFGKDNSTLLCILSGSRGHDKYIRKHAESHYGGEVDFALKSEITEGKYTNPRKYRYLLDHDVSLVQHTEYSTSSNRTSSYTNKTSGYFIYDRIDRKKYDSGFTSGMYGKILKAYFKNLEKVRLQNQNIPD